MDLIEFLDKTIADIENNPDSLNQALSELHELSQKESEVVGVLCVLTSVLMRDRFGSNKS